ncbi:MAG: citrate/2-methylcitrate synthase [Nitrospiria bacterium]
MTDKVYHGLEGVLAGESAICEVDHASGGLRYRGYRIEDLAERASFEEVSHLLLMGSLPDREALAAFRRHWVEARPVSATVLNFLRGILATVNRMDALRTAVSILGLEDPDHGVNDRAADLGKAIRLCAQMPLLLAALLNRSVDTALISEASLSHAEYLLSLLTGAKPDPFSVKVINVSLILYAEHEFNASTFAARVTASTLSDLHAAVCTAIGTLKGPLHGGANEAVMEMLIALDRRGKIKKDILERLAKKERIMGFGHRVLKKGDPRSDIIKAYTKALGERKGHRKWAELSAEIEAIMRSEKGLYPNLDFYSASAYYLLGLPIPIYTPLFVCSRVTGWAAHVIEQHEHNRLIRPRAKYTGEKPRPFVSIDDR